MNKELLHFNINRYDHYYDSVNNKGQFYLALNTFIIGGLGASFAKLQDEKICSICLYIIMGLLFITCMISIVFVLKAILPYLKSGTSISSSLIFFGSVSSYTQHEYLNKIKNATPEIIYEDLIIQSHILASGLTKKFSRLKCAGICLVIEFSLLIPFLLLFFINLKY